MDPQTYMPFGLLENADLSQVEIFFAFVSPKSGAGRQELTIKGNGEVHLFKTENYEDGVGQGRRGQLEREVVLRLLDLIESTTFFQLDDEYPPEEGHEFARRIIRVNIALDQSKTVEVQRTGVESFEKVAVAIKLAAALTLPETLKGRFFANL